MISEILTIRAPSEIESQLDQLGKTLNRFKSFSTAEEIKQGKFFASNEVSRYLDSWGDKNEQLAPKQK